MGTLFSERMTVFPASEMKNRTVAEVIQEYRRAPEFMFHREGRRERQRNDGRHISARCRCSEQIGRC